MAAVQERFIPAGYTDTLVITLCDDRPYPHGFAKIVAWASADEPTDLESYAVLAHLTRDLRVTDQTTPIDDFVPLMEKLTVREYIDKFRPTMRILSFRPVKRYRWGK